MPVHRLLLVACLLVCQFAGLCAAQADPKSAAEKDAPPLVALNKQKSVWLDPAGKRLILHSEVVLREGFLEMLACIKQSKEHESILAVPTKAQTIHAGLLALGLEPGTPVKFTPEFHPPAGAKLDICRPWTDSAGKAHRVPAQSWVRNATRRYFIEKLDKLPPGIMLPEDKNLKYDEKRSEMLWYGSMTDAERDQFLALTKDKPVQAVIKSFHEQSRSREMKADFLFTGSGFHTDEKTGEKFYQAEAGDLICVANFASSIIDVNAESSATNEGLLFEAYTERIPPIGTPVVIELVPVVKKDAERQNSPKN